MTRGGKRPGSGRKSISSADKALTVAITLPPSLLERIDAASKAAGKSRSRFVVEILSRYLESREPPE
jgi:metal-responsive CopG/Arc/MetJ family transcriptional regulator